ncbi:S-adenosyl-L-methionine-dependent methyltransferase [Xylaria arbuscula]|nr:S-adenosyl-L-methionine-dependent methyltransferase [Xylaria arbuscula]
MFNAQRTLIAALGSVEELVSDPSMRLLSLSTQYFESRALHIAAEHRVPDIIDKRGNAGLNVSVISEETGIEERKLSRILRCLTSQHIFRETRQNTFANNTVSEALVNNEDLRAYIMLFALDIYSASDYLPVALTDSNLASSYKVNETAFNLAVGTDLPRWGWLEERIPTSDVRRVSSQGYPRPTGVLSEKANTNGDISEPRNRRQISGRNVPRPELEIFGKAMVGGGKVLCAAHTVDYPWAELGTATMVDIGGGMGGFPMQLLNKYPAISFVLQDRAANVAPAERFWTEKSPDTLASGRMKIMAHDIFEENPVRNADIYWLRYILHDWSDDYCIKILSQIRKAMGDNSRLLIADQVMNTTLGCDELKAAPEPLLANYGHYGRYSHQRDLAMMSIINGIERTPSQLKQILDSSGLKMTRIWDCRTQIGIVEAIKT